MRRISVIGAGRCDATVASTAFELGQGLARIGYAVVCGGLGGVMEAACQGAKSAGGTTIGILPGDTTNSANSYVDIAIATGLGPMRNYLVVLNGEAAIAVEGSAGTLSEIGLALKIGRKVIALGHWAAVDGVIPAATPEEAIGLLAKTF